jgi:multiple sugar transport system permease protein
LKPGQFVSRKDFRNAMLFISPWIIGTLVFKLYPILASFYYSLTEYTVINPPKFVGLKNYVELMKDDVFHKSLKNTLYMASIGTFITTVFAITYAILLSDKRLRGLSVLRALAFIPTLVPAVVIGILWIWVLQADNGVINTLLGYIGIEGPGWIADPAWAKPSFILIMLWTCGGAIIIYIAGLQEIPESLYESAEIDGAGKLRQTFSITLPLLSPVILYNVVTLLINVFQWFAEPLIMTNGGPDNETLFYSLNLYRHAFQYFKMGYASAMAWILLIISMAVIIVLFALNKRFGHNESY